MQYSCRTVDREFTPAEAAEITGVSTALQRDWRRRGILSGNADGKWTRWNLNDIIRLSVMKLFSDAGMDVSQTVNLAGMALMPTLSAVACIDQAIEFDGDEISEEARDRIRFGSVRTTHPSHTAGRFLAAFGKGELDACRTDTLAGLEAFLDRELHPVLSIVDCQNLALHIVKRAGGPVIRYEVVIHNASDDE